MLTPWILWRKLAWACLFRPAAIVVGSEEITEPRYRVIATVQKVRSTRSDEAGLIPTRRRRFSTPKTTGIGVIPTVCGIFYRSAPKAPAGCIETACESGEQR